MNNLVELTAGNVINFVIADAFERGEIEDMDQEANLRKILKALIKKMLNNERILMAEGYNGKNLTEDTMLQLHPQFVQSQLL